VNIVVNGLLTTYELQGKGQLVLLLHGWGDDSRTFAVLREQLTASHQVLSLDLPGFGATQPPKEVWDLDNYAEFVGACLDKLGLKQPSAVIGHSNGGALAIRAISTGVLKPKKLVLLAASGIRNRQKGKRLALKFIAKVGNLATIWMPERYRQALRKSLYGAAGSDMLVVPELQETFKKTVRQDVREDAARLTIPTLLIYAEGDRAVPLSDGQLYNQLIKGSRLEVLEGGHFVHIDQPGRTGELIKDFLS
jgi:pimeloyl-ACP methyl ester carboxylesterase